MAIDPDTKASWFIYMVRCNDQSLYTGITTDPQRRLAEHNSSTKGARYTRAKRPVSLVWLERAPSRSEASRREYAIKRLSRSDKEDLILAVDHPLACPEPMPPILSTS